MHEKTILYFLISLGMLMYSKSAAANNIDVTNIKVTGQNTTAGVNNAAKYSQVQFDLSRENS